jgi:hypothetical protein
MQLNIASQLVIGRQVSGILLRRQSEALSLPKQAVTTSLHESMDRNVMTEMIQCRVINTKIVVVMARKPFPCSTLESIDTILSQKR